MNFKVQKVCSRLLLVRKDHFFLQMFWWMICHWSAYTTQGWKNNMDCLTWFVFPLCNRQNTETYRIVNVFIFSHWRQEITSILIFKRTKHKNKTWIWRTRIYIDQLSSDIVYCSKQYIRCTTREFHSLSFIQTRLGQTLGTRSPMRGGCLW